VCGTDGYGTLREGAKLGISNGGLGCSVTVENDVHGWGVALTVRKDTLMRVGLQLPVLWADDKADDGVG
jgi:hypothetical protein